MEDGDQRGCKRRRLRELGVAVRRAGPQLLMLRVYCRVLE
jgi:hypothetical protein